MWKTYRFIEINTSLTNYRTRQCWYILHGLDWQVKMNVWPDKTSPSIGKLWVGVARTRVILLLREAFYLPLDTLTDSTWLSDVMPRVAVKVRLPVRRDARVCKYDVTYISDPLAGVDFQQKCERINCNRA